MSATEKQTELSQVTEVTDEQLLSVAQKALETEHDALNQFSQEISQGELSGQFIKATKTIAQIKGRVIVTGMGKSGHVGLKIATTLSSTGTPSLFIHPSEASHGDLGMISENDCVIAISNSGEAPELKDTIAYTRRFSLPLIAITSQTQSTLAQQSDIVLRLTKAPEACPIGKAPTTSAILTMAMGDALVVSLMKYKGFTLDDYSIFHPGGKLGAKLIKVDDIMRHDEELPLITQDANMGDAIDAMSKNNFGRAIVVSQSGELKGFVSDGDLRRHMSPDLRDKPVADIMSTNPKQVDRYDLAAKALAIMNRHQITDLIITQEQKPIGMIRLHDVLNAGIA